MRVVAFVLSVNRQSGVLQKELHRFLERFVPDRFHRRSERCRCGSSGDYHLLVGNSTPADGYGTPSSNTDPVTSLSFRQKAVKYGRTTGLTSGKVWAINSSVNVNYGTSGVALFVGQIVISGGGFNNGGDSGSLVVIENGLNPIGLLFAGGGNSTFVNPIDDVLSALSAELGPGVALSIDGNP